MERIRIDARDLRLRARHRQARADRQSEAAAPVRFAPPPAGPDVDEDLLGRIDALLDEQRRDGARRRDEDEVNTA